MARVAKVVKISAQELDRVKQNRNGVVGIPRKRLEERAEALVDKGEWTLFIDILALLVFGIVLFPNVDELVDLVAIDAFLAFHHSKESPVIAIVATYHTAEARNGQNQGPRSLSPREKMSGVTTNIYLRKKLEKPKKTKVYVF